MTEIVLVTGASRGLGAALAEALAPDRHLVAVARTVGALEELDDRVRAAGGQATLAPLDVTGEEPMAQLASGIAARWGRLDLWLHAAVHAPPLAPAGHVQAKDLDRSIAVNVTATARLIRLLEPLLLAAEAGTAVFFEDPRAGEKFFGAYGATKAAQLAMVQSWQAEAARIGPRVVIARPPPMPTATRARFFPGEDRSALTPQAEAAARILEAL